MASWSGMVRQDHRKSCLAIKSQQIKKHIQRYLNYVLVDNCMRIDHVLNMLQHVRNMIKYVTNMTNIFKDHGKSCHVKPSKNNRLKTCLNIFKPYFDGQLDDDNSLRWTCYNVVKHVMNVMKHVINMIKHVIKIMKHVTNVIEHVIDKHVLNHNKTYIWTW